MSVRVIGDRDEMRHLLEKVSLGLVVDWPSVWACDFPASGTLYFVLCSAGQEDVAQRRIYGKSVLLIENSCLTEKGQWALEHGFGAVLKGV